MYPYESSFKLVQLTVSSKDHLALNDIPCSSEFGARQYTHHSNIGKCLVSNLIYMSISCIKFSPCELYPYCK